MVYIERNRDHLAMCCLGVLATDPSESFWFQLEICHTFMNNLHENHNHSSMLLILQNFYLPPWQGCSKRETMLIGKHMEKCYNKHLPTLTCHSCNHSENKTHEGISDHDCHMTALPVVRPLVCCLQMTVLPDQRPFSMLNRCWTDAEEAAQLPKTYPIQLGLAYLLLVRPLRAWGEAASWFRSQWIDVFGFWMFSGSGMVAQWLMQTCRRRLCFFW